MSLNRHIAELSAPSHINFVDQGMKHSLSLLAAVSSLSLSAAMAGEITGTVTDASGNVPLRGAEILIAETGQRVATARDGSYRIVGLDAGEYTVEVSYAGDQSVLSVTVESAEDVAVLDVVLGQGDVLFVRGQRGQLNSSISQQRSADGIVSVLSADDIGQLPDENVAESVRRVLGTSIANDQGEGRFVSIRGINSQLNTTSVNGVRLTSPEANDRRVALDVIDADILSNVTINKTLSADMDGDAIGGSINLETISGLDREDRLVKLKLGGIFTERTDELDPEVSATYVDNFMEGRFGVALSAAFQARQFASDNIEVDGGFILDNGPFAYPADELEMRNYDIERRRTSLSANFDYMLTDNTRVYLNSLYNEFADQEYRNRVELKAEDVDVGFDANNIVRFVPGGEENVEFDRDVKDRLEEQRIWSVVTGFEHEADLFTFDGSIAYTHAEEEEANRIDANFDYDFEGANEIVGVDVSDLLRPRLVFPNAEARTSFLNPSNFELDNVEATNGLTEDDELALTFNAQREMLWGNQYPGFIKSGAKIRVRDKSYDLDFKAFDYEGDDITLAELGMPVEYPRDLGLFGPAGNPWALRDFVRENTSLFELDTGDSLEESLISSFEASEDIYAGYVMGQVDINALRLTGGLRIEHTQVDATGNIYNEDTETATPNNFDDSYTDFLPSIAARYELGDRTVLRASYYRSLVRPNFGQFVPAGGTNDDQELEAGNPDLERTIANNFDLLAEFYPTGSSVIQGGIFFKTLDNFIASFETDVPGTINGIDYAELESFTNLDGGEIFGAEIGYQQALTMLPGLLDGLLVGVNYTYTDSEAELADGTTIELPGQSETIFNAIVGYEKGPLNMRLAYSFKDENIDDVDVDGIGEGRLVLEQEFLDFSAKVEVAENLRVYFDAVNLLDTPLEVADRIDGVSYLNQYEEYGRRFQAGLLFNF